MIYKGCLSPQKTNPYLGLEGIMSRGFNNWNRTFMAKEPGYGPIPPEDEKGSHW